MDGWISFTGRLTRNQVRVDCCNLREFPAVCVTVTNNYRVTPKAAVVESSRNVLRMGAGGLPETVGKGVDGACGLMAQCQN